MGRAIPIQTAPGRLTCRLVVRLLVWTRVSETRLQTERIGVSTFTQRFATIYARVRTERARTSVGTRIPTTSVPNKNAPT